MTRPLKIAIPNKGRLSDESTRLLHRAGIPLRGSSDRKLFASALNGRLQILFLRAHDIPAFVADGTVDAGITGLDVVMESEANVDIRLDLGFGKCRLAVAVPEENSASRVADLADDVRIATSFPVLTKKFFDAAGKSARITEVTGACEVTPKLGVADVITDLVSSGSTLMMNHLREIETILESSCRLITTTTVDAEIAQDLERVEAALASVVAAENKRYLLADIPRSNLDEIRMFLPGVAGPTVVDIAGVPDMVAIQVVVDEDAIFDAVHRLKGLGGRGILIVPIDRLVN